MLDRQLVSVPIDEHVVLWLEDHNKYIVVKPLAAQIISSLIEGDDEEDMLKGLVIDYSLTTKEAKALIVEVKDHLASFELNRVPDNSVGYSDDVIKQDIEYRHCYQIEDKIILIEFESEYLEYLLHPKYQHLEVFEVKEFDSNLRLLKQDNQLLLFVNGDLKWRWRKEEENFLLGKVAMEILNTVYSKNDDDWLAVLHAAGISNGEECIAFSGACGAGKSTLAAMLLAQAYDVLADDFLAMDFESMQIHAFPAAISIKGKSIEMLDAEFPGLKDNEQRSFCRSGKPMRYMASSAKNNASKDHVPCIAIVFVEYEEGAGLDFQQIDTISALQELVPETWISPNAEHAERFLHWLKKTPCYLMKYDDNNSMLDRIDMMFRHEI